MPPGKPGTAFPSPRGPSSSVCPSRGQGRRAGSGMMPLAILGGRSQVQPRGQCSLLWSWGQGTVNITFCSLLEGKPRCPGHLRCLQPPESPAQLAQRLHPAGGRSSHPIASPSPPRAVGRRWGGIIPLGPRCPQGGLTPELCPSAHPTTSEVQLPKPCPCPPLRGPNPQGGSGAGVQADPHLPAFYF